MSGTFNPQILVEKLTKLNNSQQSIETLSHWCIFHMSKAKQVVETWAIQFRCSPRDQRLAFLYLANDILQNSRRKGSEFVGEFWKVLPDALRDVIDNSGESGRNAALRLVKIWEERKVFGSQGPILKEEIVGRHKEICNRNEKLSGVKLQQSAGNALDKIVSGYQNIYGGQLDEDALITKCKNTITCVEKVGKEIGGDFKSGNGLRSLEELKGHNATLKDCIGQLATLETSRNNLVCCLREVLQEQEMKLDLVRNELEVAHTQSKKADKICKQFLNPVGTEQSAPLMYTQQVTISDENNKSAAETVAAKLTASTSSAEMLSYVLSSFASEGISGNSLVSNDYPLVKRAKVDNIQTSQPPPPPSSPPPLPPMPPTQAYPVPPFMETAYLYTTSQPPLGPPLQGHPVVGPLINDGGYQIYQMEGVFSSQPMAPMSGP